MIFLWSNAFTDFDNSRTPTDLNRCSKAIVHKSNALCTSGKLYSLEIGWSLWKFDKIWWNFWKFDEIFGNLMRFCSSDTLKSLKVSSDDESRFKNN